MAPLGRPRVVEAPPCPACGTDRRVAAHGLKEIEGQPRRSFRCGACRRVFVPGVEWNPPSPDLKAAVRRVRAETGVPLRLLAEAITRHLGVPVSHTTVGSWCRGGPTLPPDGEAAPCEYLSVLWALHREIRDEARATHPGA